eukprot:CAMPEP_0185019120 /NCGR_PEP_ID=MMETSP1103-20130426/1740_1 /TAXON_ID=36769 /ORGANISM="Paraphysomonas bandaiensis, Strain Caron Lab Isolate" /LENGTH=44 /DNA_ID= /DNA_START= /DNA_END= /DNA_ORIENTATION=
MEGPVSEATAVPPSVHLQQQHCKPVNPMDTEGPVNEATAKHASV